MSGLVIVGIVLFSLTDLSSVVLPMDDRYLDVLIPATADGSEPFTLNELNHELEEKTLSVAGWMTNRSEVEVENVIAVITARETTGRFPATLEIPVDPGLIPPDGTGMFSMTVTLREKPNNYSIRFKLENGPFVPHRDERALQFWNPTALGKVRRRRDYDYRGKTGRTGTRSAGGDGGAGRCDITVPLGSDRWRTGSRVRPRTDESRREPYPEAGQGRSRSDTRRGLRRSPRHGSRDAREPQTRAGGTGPCPGLGPSFRYGECCARVQQHTVSDQRFFRISSSSYTAASAEAMLDLRSESRNCPSISRSRSKPRC